MTEPLQTPPLPEPDGASPGARDTASASSEAGELFRDYCSSPSRYWGESSRQALKLQTRLSRAARERGVSPTDVALDAVRLAQQRSGSRRPTVYLSNIGSSGSHWLEAMLVDGAGLLGAGEVYLPVPLRERLAGMPRPEQAVFIDALNLVHAGLGDDSDPQASVVNSQHAARPAPFLDCEPGAVRVLLLRDPLEVVLSRTFRKDEYRNDVHAGSEDIAYLNVNIKKVSSFLTAALEESYDLTVRYEDLRIDPVPAMVAICQRTRTPRRASQLTRAARLHHARTVSRRGTPGATNLFAGKAMPYPEEAVTRARRLLTPLRAQLGYPLRASSGR